MCATYCNPLPIPEFAASQSGCVGPQALADPAVIRHEGRWYLFVSAAQAWESEDLLNWIYRPVDLPREVIGPAIEEHDGWFYLAGNGGRSLLRSRHPLGPWEDLGPIHDYEGNRVHWADLYFFSNDDGTFYCYHHPGTGVGSHGVFVTELDPALHFTRARGPSIQCFAHDPAHVWERWGDANEFNDVAWIEAACVIKHAGRYYLTYSGCGTEWRRYAIGCYTADSPTGPWVYDERSPLLVERGGMLNGTGHHAMTLGPDGQWWMIYHVLFAQNHKFDRRLAMDPVGFDAEGRMIVRGPTETPQCAPGGSQNPLREKGPGLIPLSINKPASASSHAPGRTPDYAVDNYIRTWWEPADATLPQWLSVDLLGEFTIHACRLIFSLAGAPRRCEPEPYCYRIEISDDGNQWRTMLDKTASATPRNIEYDVLPPTRGRHLRVAFTSAPHQRKLGLIQLTAFGTA